MVNVRLIPSSFDPKADAKALRDAMEGLGEFYGYPITALLNPKYHLPVYITTRLTILYLAISSYTYLRLLNWPHCA